MTSTYSRIRASGSSLFDGDTADGADAQMTVGMAERASRQALDDAGLAAADIDFLVLATTSPDIVFPNGGCLLQQRLGLRGCAAFSVVPRVRFRRPQRVVRNGSPKRILP